MQKTLGFTFLLKCLIFLFSVVSFIQTSAQKKLTPSPYDQAPKPKKDYPASIHKLTETSLPADLIKTIQKYNKAQMDSLKEDYHENTYEDGIEYVIKTMLRFVDGHIIGFIKKEPMLQDGPGEYIKTMIDIPLEWCGFDSLHQEHCVKTPKEMAEFEGEIKPKDWHQKIDPTDVVKEISDQNIDLLQLLD